MGYVARSKESFGADKQIGMMFSPKHSTAIAEVRLDTLDRLRHCFDHVEAATYKERTVLIRQCNGLFWREAVLSSCGVVVHVTSSGLINQPFFYISFVRVGLLRQFGGRYGASVGNRFVEAELLAEISERRTQ